MMQLFQQPIQQGGHIFRSAAAFAWQYKSVIIIGKIRKTIAVTVDAVLVSFLGVVTH